MKFKHGIRASMVMLLLAILLATSASAEIIKHLEFDTDGSLPSDDPQIAFTATAGVVEADVFSVSGGILTGVYPGGNSFPITYAYPGEFYGSWPTNGGIDPSDPWSVEIRMRILENAGGYFTLWTSSRRFPIYFTASGVRLHHGGNPNWLDYPCDTSQWHVLRMWSEDGLYFSASVDGVVMASNLAGLNDANILNGFFIRLNPHSEPAHVQWDYVRFESGENAVASGEVTFGDLKDMYR